MVKAIVGFLMLLLLGGAILGFTVGACFDSRELAALSNENLEIRSEMQQLEKENSLLKEEQARSIERQRSLEIRLSDLDPEVPDIYEESDLVNDQLRIQRVHSVRSGDCFDLRGNSRCLFFEIPEADGAGYLIFQANKRFGERELGLTVMDHRGRRLSVLTPELAIGILKWERSNPSRPIELAVY